MADKICGIYKITNTFNNKVYIGQSIDVRERIYEHKRKLRLQQHYNKYLQNAYNKHGEYFEYEVIEECCLPKLDEREMYWIGFYRSNNNEFGYNIMAGGQLNRPCAERTKELISRSVLCIETDVIYPSVAEAQRVTGIMNISLACNDKLCHSGGLHWCFADEATPEKIEQIMNRTQKRNTKMVVCIETGDVFDSLTEAANAYGLSASSISASCNNYHQQYKKSNSYHWKFVEGVAS